MSKSKWTPERVAKLRTMWTRGDHVDDIAKAFGTSPGAIYMQASVQALPARKRKRLAGAAKRPGRKRDATGQRRFTGVVSEGPRIVLAPHHPASRKGTTFFPSMVKPAAMMTRLLKGGQWSRKLGGTMEKGRWRGQTVHSLTLEERETCARSCLEWATCYGNNMPFAARILDDGTLLRRLWGELASLNAEFPNGYVVRLHVLGDFYSVEYVDFWRQALDDFPALNVFGFTARIPPEPVGIAVAELVRDQMDRFMVRFSGAGGDAMCSEVVDSAADATGILCPAESDPDRCCATCGLCPQTTKKISFIRH